MNHPPARRALLAAASVLVTAVAVTPAVLDAAPGDTATATYSGTNETVPNPERGFHKGVSVEDSTGGSTTSISRMTSLYDDGFRLARVYIRLDSYRNKPIDAALLANIDELFDNARASGIKLIPRFSYNFGTDPDAPMNRIEEHIDQVGPILRDNQDVIAVMQSGFIGAWGEWHSSTNDLTNPADRARVRNALLDAVPDSRMVQFRYPKDLIEFEATPLDAAGAWTGSDQARTAHKNDCVLANGHDAGTYWPLSRRDEYRSYLEVMTEFTATGGETCQVSAGEQRTDCGTAVREFETFHWDYLNLDFYEDTMDKWRNQGCFDDIEQRLGYRYRMIEATASTEVRAGERLDVSLDIANDGFGKLYNERPLDVVLRSDSTGSEYRLRHSDDARSVMPLPGETRNLDLGVAVPSNLPDGNYSISIELPDGSASLANDSRYNVQFANSGTWNAATGTNELQLDVAVNDSAPVTTTPATTTPATTTPVTTTPVTTAQPTTLPPIDGPVEVEALVDAYRENGRGIDGGELRVESGSRERITYLRFDTAGLAGAERLQLQLTVGSDRGAGTISVHEGLGGTWSGGVLDDNTSPEAGATLAVASGSFAPGDAITFDLGSSAVTGANTDLVVRIDGAGSDDVSFASLETGAAPTLIASAG